MAVVSFVTDRTTMGTDDSVSNQSWMRKYSFTSVPENMANKHLCVGPDVTLK